MPAYHPVEYGEQLHEKCPVCGLPVTSRPEWYDIPVSDTYSVTFKIVGDRILLVMPKGNPGEWGVKRLFEKRAEVIDKFIGPNASYVEIRDFVGIRVNRSPRSARVQMVQGLRTDQSRILGFIGFNIPKTIQLGMQVGKKLYHPPFCFNISKNYETAILDALSLIQKAEKGVKKLIYATVTKNDWHLQFNNGAASRYEIINDNILFGQCMGTMTMDNIVPIADTMNNIADYIVSKKNKYYIISDFSSRARSSKAARKAYLDYIKQLYQKYPFEIYIFLGDNRFFSGVINLTKSFLPFPTYCARSMTDALNLVRKLERGTIASPEEQNKNHALYSHDTIQQYVEELSQYLGRINWEVEGIHHTRHTDETHPFNKFFDAIDLIKGDVDDLLCKRKQAEEELRRSEEKYRTIIEEIEDGYYEVNLKGDATFCNDPVSRILGYSHEELIGMNNRRYMSKATAERIYSVFNKVYETEEPVRGLVYEVIRKDGSRGYIDISISLIKNKAGEKVGFRGIMRDVTKRKQTDEALMAAKKAAEETSEAKSNFLANISHELRTPMNGILGMTGFLLETDLNEEQREYAQITYDQGERLLAVINDLLDFSRLENNRLVLCTDRIHMPTLFNDIRDATIKAIDQKKVAFSCEYDTALPEEFIGDPRRIKQIVSNLLDNAIKFTPAGLVELRCTCREIAGQKVTLSITVRDTGIGIPEGNTKNLFEPFTQADSSTTRPYDGAGLGLPITRQLVEMMNGTIQVESEEGRGTTFTCTLQLEKAPATSSW
ncbi:MAG: ATP-binding protein [Thermodesulfobacteriota bacterium]|nr:ATP-binding protein [Thermodesulfobacteriota bacterium]